MKIDDSLECDMALCARYTPEGKEDPNPFLVLFQHSVPMAFVPLTVEMVQHLVHFYEAKGVKIEHLPIGRSLPGESPAALQ